MWRKVEENIPHTNCAKTNENVILRYMKVSDGKSGLKCEVGEADWTWRVSGCWACKCASQKISERFNGITFEYLDCIQQNETYTHVHKDIASRIRDSLASCLAVKFHFTKKKKLFQLLFFRAKLTWRSERKPVTWHKLWNSTAELERGLEKGFIDSWKFGEFKSLASLEVSTISSEASTLRKWEIRSNTKFRYDPFTLKASFRWRHHILPLSVTMDHAIRANHPVTHEIFRVTMSHRLIALIRHSPFAACSRCLLSLMASIYILRPDDFTTCHHEAFIRSLSLLLWRLPRNLRMNEMAH